MPNVENSFAVPYREDQIGRLMRNGSVCFFLSFTMVVMGRRHAQNIIAIKKQTKPITNGVCSYSEKSQRKQASTDGKKGGPIIYSQYIHSLDVSTVFL